VFGDADAQSRSISNAIEQLARIDTLTMRYSSAMLTSLRNIEGNIGGLTNLIVRSNGADASASGAKTGFKSDPLAGSLAKAVQGVGSLLGKIPVLGGLLGGLVGAIGKLIGSLFGTKTSIVGQGIAGAPQTLGDVLGGGFDARYFSDIKKTKKFLGVSVGSSTSTQFTGADPELKRQFSLIFSGFYDAISAAAGPLGLSLDEVQARLKTFVIDIGKIDLKGLTAAQIQEKLAAVFGAAADQMARYAIGGLEAFQKVGEGYFETLIRVASSVEAVTQALGLLGLQARSLGIAASLDLVDLFGSVSDMVSATDAYFQLYYTSAEQAAARTAQMADRLQALGLVMPGSIAGFRALVEAQDLTTEAGRAAYAALLQLAPAFADLVGAAQDAASAAAIADERLSLERRLLELRGDTATLRAMELASLDASNRALQEEVWALEDQAKAANEAAAAAEKLRSAWAQISDGLLAEVKRIRGELGGGSSYAETLAQFNAASMAARAGDQEAGRALPGLSRALLTAAGNMATSSEGLARIQGLTAASLEETLAIIGATGAPTLVAGDVSTTSQPAWWDQFVSGQTPGVTTAANDTSLAMVDELQGLRQELSELRVEQQIAAAAIAAGTGKTARILERVAPDGDAIAVRTAA